MTTMSEQRDLAWVQAHTAEQVTAANAAGELDVLLGRTQYEAAKTLAADVASAPDRIIAAAYGSTPANLAGRRDLDSTWFASKRADLTPEQQKKLSWVESATPAEVYAAERAGELDQLTGKDVSDETARIAAVGAAVRESMRAAGVGI